MLQALTTILQSILKMLPAATAGGQVGNIINIVIALVPVLVQSYQKLLPIAQQIIGALQQSDEITDDQIAQLEAASAAIDAHFDATAAAARAADAAAALAASIGIDNDVAKAT